MRSAAYPQTEAQFTHAVLDLLGALGWRAVFHRTARTARGEWRTAISGPGAIGWPDIFAVRRSRAIAVELKAEGGHFRPGQREWLRELAAAGVETYCWRPSDWSEIERVLGRT